MTKRTDQEIVRDLAKAARKVGVPRDQVAAAVLAFARAVVAAGGGKVDPEAFFAALAKRGEAEAPKVDALTMDPGAFARHASSRYSFRAH